MPSQNASCQKLNFSDGYGKQLRIHVPPRKHGDHAWFYTSQTIMVQVIDGAFCAVKTVTYWPQKILQFEMTIDANQTSKDLDQWAVI